MEFIQITSRDDFRADEIYASYSNAFYEDERRNADQFAQLFKNPKACVFAIMKELDFVGYLIGWEMSHFIFLEHFEIFPAYRNQNLGSETLAKLFQDYSKIILESAPDHTEEDQRRIHFYLKNNFEIIDKTYTQPSYSSEKNPLSLWLLSNYKPENLSVVTEEIYDIVYNR